MYHHIFISHAWKYDEAYIKVVSWLEGLPIKNYSVPNHDPLHTKTKDELKIALAEQISHARTVIIISGMYAAYSDWIMFEIEEAKRQGKYIIALEPWGQKRTPQIIQSNADVTVRWQRLSLLKALLR